MPKVARELSAQAVARLREIGDHAVGGVPGLFLRVAENSRHWCFRYSLQGQRRLMGLGSYPSVSLAKTIDIHFFVNSYVSTVVTSIKNGSKGKWGAIPMPPNKVSDEEAQKLAQWILSLK